MAKLPSNWDGFFARVEGRGAAVGAPIIEGKPAWGDNADPPGRQRLSLVAELLRGSGPVPDELREWLANLFDENGVTEFYIKSLTRRRKGPPTAPIGQHWDAARHFETLLQNGEPRKRALWATGEKFGVGRSSLEKAVAELRAAKEEDRLLRRSESE